MSSEQRVKIALQKSGRLFEGSVDLLRKSGLSLRTTTNKFLVKEDGFPSDFMLVRDDDILELVHNEICDLGIIGENTLIEYQLASPTPKNLQIYLPLNFSQCRLSLAAPIESGYTSLQDLQGCTIATSYPFTVQNFLRKENIQAKVVTMHGSVEVAPKIGVSDVICDIVSSGATLAENGLKELHTILRSQAVLVGRAASRCPEIEAITARLQQRLKGAMNAKQCKYIMLHADRKHLTSVQKALPGCEAPTILELQGLPDKVAVHAVSKENIFWETMEDLKKAGATSILILPIEKMIGDL